MSTTTTRQAVTSHRRRTSRRAWVWTFALLAAVLASGFVTAATALR